jgi:membrane-bound ClpP family serine protease
MLSTSSFWFAAAAVVAGLLLLIGTIFLARVANLARRKKSVSRETLIGEIGEARTNLDPHGTVTVRCRSYRAASNAQIPAGGRIRVTGIGEILSVEPYSR